jgi:hypothetical protein
MAVNHVAQARDFEMGGDSPYRYSIAATDSNAATRHGAASPSRARRGTLRRVAKPLAEAGECLAPSF